MTVDEAKTAAKDLRVEIEILISRFEAESHCLVSDLEIQRFTIGGKATIAMNIKLFHSGR